MESTPPFLDGTENVQREENDEDSTLHDDAAGPCCGCFCCERLMRCCLGGTLVLKYKAWVDRFWQQRIFALRPYIYPRNVVYMYILMSLVLIALGVVAFIADSHVVEVNRVRYDNRQQCSVGEHFTATRQCNVTFSVVELMKAPVYFYYGIKGMSQLKGEWPPPKSYSTTCTPLEHSSAQLPPRSLNFGTQPNGVVLPCGVFPATLFNDSYSISSSNGPLQLSKSGTFFDFERGHLYGHGPSSGGYTDDINTLLTSPNFMVWMRPGTFPNFVKPYYVIQQDLNPGKYSVQIRSNYPVGQFGGEKFIYLSTLNFLNAGRVFELAIMLLSAGGACLLVATWVSFEILRESRRGDTPASVVQLHLDADADEEAAGEPASK